MTKGELLADPALALGLYRGIEWQKKLHSRITSERVNTYTASSFINPTLAVAQAQRILLISLHGSLSNGQPVEEKTYVAAGTPTVA